MHTHESANSSFVPPVTKSESTTRAFQVPSPETAETAEPDIQARLDHANRFGHDLTQSQPSVQRQVEPDVEREDEEEPVVQTKLTIGQPGDKYEQEADAMAAKVMAMPESAVVKGEGVTGNGEGVQRQVVPEEEEETLQARPQIQARGSAPAVPGGFESKLAQHKGGGRSLSDETRAFMEPRFGTDFSSVRIHETPDLANAIQAQAFTHGQDIYFNAGKYDPGSRRGKELLAHELTHVVQQVGNPQIVQARKYLGGASWDNPIYREQPDQPHPRVSFKVITLTENEWRKKLKNCDDDNEVKSIQGFLLLATDPSYATRKKHPLGFKNFKNYIKRPPNDAEIMNFMRALYSLGTDLDLPNHAFEAWQNGPNVLSMRQRVAMLIAKYQGKVLQEISKKGRTVNSENIEAIVDQGDDSRITSSILYNAVATASKGLDILAASPGRSRTRKRKRSDAYMMISNAGHTIRYALEKHATKIAAREAAMSSVFDIVWSSLPGGGALVSASKTLLRKGAARGIKAIAVSGSNPKKQLEGLRSKYEEAARKMINEGKWDTDTEQFLEIGINKFLNAVQ